MKIITLLILLLITASAASAQTTAFTYQGRLSDASATAASGSYLLKFELYDAASGGTLIDTLTDVPATVSNGVFTVQLNFTAANAFGSGTRFLQISVKRNAGDSYTTLSPRQQITSTPYAIRALNAANADNATNATTANSATTAGNVTGVVAIANGGTGSSTQNFVDLSAAQTVAGAKTFSIPITGDLNGNASTATTAATANGLAATAGSSVVNSINDAATNTTINSNRLAADLVRLSPLTVQQSSAGANDPLLNIQGNYSAGGTYQSNFRISHDGILVASGEHDGGGYSLLTEGAGTRMLWYPRKSAFRAGTVNGTQWDDANIGLFSTAFGQNVRALGDYSLAVGKNTTAANFGTIALGEGNIATGANSVALGYYASTSTTAGSPRTGSFVFSDRSIADGTTLFNAQVTNAAHWRVTNGFRIFTSSNLSSGVTIQNGSTTSNWGQDNAVISTSTGAYLSTGGTWTNASSRDLKTNFESVNARDVLRKVLNLPIQTWNYKAENQNIRHIGAMSQDFQSAFKLGGSDRAISTVDADGVALAAIQGLNAEMNDRTARLQAENDALKKQLTAQKMQFDALEERLKKLEQAKAPKRRKADRRK